MGGVDLICGVTGRAEVGREYGESLGNPGSPDAKKGVPNGGSED